MLYIKIKDYGVQEIRKKVSMSASKQPVLKFQYQLYFIMSWKNLQIMYRVWARKFRTARKVQSTKWVSQHLDRNPESPLLHQLGNLPVPTNWTSKTWFFFCWRIINSIANVWTPPAECVIQPQPVPHLVDESAVLWFHEHRQSVFS